jgi:hypothetical protein
MGASTASTGRLSPRKENTNMSPQAGFVLMDQIAPRLKSVMPSIKPVGAEDTEELLQDAMAVAAKMLHDLKARGKTVTPGNIVFYTVFHMKSGRRSYSAGRTDTMGGGTQLVGKSMVLSFEEPAGFDHETMEEIPLGDMLAAHGDDPSTSATRLLDWDGFLDSHNPRYRSIVQDLAVGKNSMDSARETGASYFTVRQLRERLALELREYMGEEAIADAMKIPAWRGNIQADHEKAACRVERRQ